MILIFFMSAEREVEGLKFSMCLAAKGESTTLISSFSN